MRAHASLYNLNVRRPFNQIGQIPLQLMAGNPFEATQVDQTLLLSPWPPQQLYFHRLQNSLLINLRRN